MFKKYYNCRLAKHKGSAPLDIRPYWSYKDNHAVIDGVVMKGRHINIPERQKQQVLDQLHVNHMGIEKTKLLACESVYWVNINNDIENHVKNCSMCLEFQQTQPKEKTINHNIPLRPWEVIGADVFQLNSKNYLCNIDYRSKFLVIKRMEGLSAESLIAAVKIIFAEYGIPCRLMSDAGGNLISEFKNSKISVTDSMLSKQYHCRTTTKTIVVQQEDRGLWTHATIIGKGNHNHHNRSYKIQVTSTGRIMTHNRQHI